MEAFILELLEQAGQSGDSLRMDVVQEQNSFAARFQPPHRCGDDLLAADPVVPIVGYRIGGEYRKAARGELAFDGVGSRQAGNAEEWRQIFLVAERGPH